jgi:hypothetical protein
MNASDRTQLFPPFGHQWWSMNASEKKPLPRIKEINLDRLDCEPGTVVLSVSSTGEAKFEATMASADVGNLVASLISSVGRTLDIGEITSSKAELASTRVFVRGAVVGFGNTIAGPVLVAQTGGLALIFGMTHGDLLDMARRILEDIDNTEDIESPPKHH